MSKSNDESGLAIMFLVIFIAILISDRNRSEPDDGAPQKTEDVTVE